MDKDGRGLKMEDSIELEAAVDSKAAPRRKRKQLDK